MSFILDVLQKSASERLRKGAPGIASIPQGRRQRPSPKWIWLVLALFAVNLVVLAGLLYTADTSTAPVPPIVRDAIESPAAEIVTRTAAERPAVPSATDTPPESTVEEPARQPVQVIQKTVPTQSGTVDNGLETFNDLRAKGVLNLPDMHLDIHVYSGEPADRFVFVNMSKYKENARLTEGPVVAEITPDGVVLDYQGTMFLLPRE